MIVPRAYLFYNMQSVLMLRTVVWKERNSLRVCLCVCVTDSEEFMRLRITILLLLSDPTKWWHFMTAKIVFVVIVVVVAAPASNQCKWEAKKLTNRLTKSYTSSLSGAFMFHYWQIHKHIQYTYINCNVSIKWLYICLAWHHITFIG